MGAEQGRYLVLVGLELIEGPFEGGILIARVLEFDHGQGEAIDEQHHIRTPVVAALDHRELVHCEPVVSVHIVEVDQPGDVSADGPVLAGYLDRHALDQIAVEAAVLFD